MAEKIVSPGVFTNENDYSFLPIGIGQIGAAIIGPTVKGPAFVPTVIESQQDYDKIFGGTNEYMYTPYTIKNYLKYAGRVTVVRVLQSEGYTVSPVAVYLSGSLSGSVTQSIKLAALLSSTNEAVTTLSISETGTSKKDTFFLSGSSLDIIYTSSFDTTSANYLTKIFGTDAWGSKNVYCYNNFSELQTTFSSSAAVTAVVVSNGLNFSGSDGDYSEASTPWITSQLISGQTQNLFKVITLSHGNAANYEFKVAISDIKPAGSIPGSDYGTFTLTIRGVYGKFGSYDTDRKPDVKEIYPNLTLDPTQPNFIGLSIGTRYYDFTTDQDGKTKIVSYGDYPNISKLIRIELADAVAKGTASPELVPFGFAKLNLPVNLGVSDFLFPVVSYVADQSINSEYNARKCWGFEYESTDNLNYLAPIPSGSTNGSNVVFNLMNFSSSLHSTYNTQIIPDTACPIELKKFVVPFQGGFDGVNPAKRKNVGSDMSATNSLGFNVNGNTSTGYAAYKKAIDTISNGEEFDINMLVIPGIVSKYASSITNYAMEMINDRNDVFYIMDSAAIDDTVAQAISNVDLLDDNYTATYYPWVKIKDTNINKMLWVPPSVVLPGVMAYNDKVGYEWYAPAGLNRGGLTNVLETRTRLTHSERDDLYLGRINPIATFPGQGVTVWGQKTLQVKPSALDRINVRRLLIAIKKYIASATRYLVFEQNVTSTRNRFLSICNPYLESIQQRAGLYAFKVVMDDTNNPPELIDQNMMKGEIWLKPTKTAEMIIIDFNIMPTGASFGA